MRRERNFIGPAGMGGMVSLWGASSLIRSVQSGAITLTDALSSATATVTAVDLPNSRLRFLGQTNDDYTSLPSQGLAKIVLTNATTITANVISNQNAGKLHVVNWELVEYAPGVIKSVQRGTITNAAESATITAVDTAKTSTDYLGNTDTGGGLAMSCMTRLILTNATTVTVSSVIPSNTQLTSYQAVEWF